MSKKIIHLRLYVLLITLLLTVHPMYGNEYNKAIIPVTYETLNDSTIRNEVQSIITGNLNKALDNYRAKNYKSHVINKYWRDSWRFYTVFNDTTVLCKKNQCELYQKHGNDVIKSIRFFHVKYGLRFTPPSLDTLNAAIAKDFIGHFKYSVSAYSSKDRLRHYLLLSLESATKKAGYLFIIKESRFYQCVAYE